ncbi:NAD(P)H-dependent oxidoreductase [Opitutus terrae]|uniref:NAD(P)H dehydrogenase (Quinone) n=1 Tax=Opitutus terrae (strain DSM 11246 / JCM 15787 / PB90-1) TaxID=452637 RepID=B1ZZJ6_OPITP|nr:NAD(P)H-dependent oxidoreductase [Opitutus terrae]ACB76399.1 NAD(P)H dehydrogenase (quinone) [Opitutus terrae PB90-1]
MNLSLILAHPNPASFNHAIATTAATELRRLGHTVVLHDLYAERFDPILPAAEFAQDAKLPALIAAHCAEIAAADGIIIVHPNWWGQPPAILKGWIDRVLRAGQAYNFIEGDNGEGVPVGLLKAKAAVVFNTANTPKEREDAVFGDPLELLWKKCVFDLCGVTRVHRETFRVVIASTPAVREEWLGRVRKIVADEFPA